MASRIGHPQWNNADVDDPESVDVVGMRELYAARSVPWGVRVARGCPLVAWAVPVPKAAHGPALVRS
jgi:hypothetical protein